MSNRVLLTMLCQGVNLLDTRATVAVLAGLGAACVTYLSHYKFMYLRLQVFALVL